MLGVAAVETVGDVADLGAVLLGVGVEQQQRHPADLGDPDPCGQGAVVGQADRDLGDVARLVPQQRDGQAVGVEDRVGLLLPAVAGEELAEVAVPVQQPDTHDRYAEVAGGLEVVAGQDAEAAGVLRQHGSDAELRGEVGDGAGGVLGAGPLVPTVAGEVGPQVLAGGPEPRQEALVAGQLGQPLLADGAEQLDRVVTHGLPCLRVDRGEDVLGLGVPGPAQVAGQLAERFEGRGQHGLHGESTDCSHGCTVADLDLNDPIRVLVRSAGLVPPSWPVTPAVDRRCPGYPSQPSRKAIHA